MAVIRKKKLAGAAIVPTSRKRTTKHRSVAPAPPKTLMIYTKEQMENSAFANAYNALWKPTKIPNGFTLVIDTREQKPLFQLRTIPINHKVLEIGDYAIEGYEDIACVERKMLSDFDSFIGQEREKHTIPKMERMRDMLWAALVIECSPRKLYGKRKYGKITKEHVRGFLKKCRVQYGIHVFISDDREELERYILDHLVYVFEGMTK